MTGVVEGVDPRSKFWADRDAALSRHNQSDGTVIEALWVTRRGRFRWDAEAEVRVLTSADPLSGYPVTRGWYYYVGESTYSLLSERACHRWARKYFNRLEREHRARAMTRPVLREDL